MSEENVEIIRQGVEEWRRRGGGASGVEAIPEEAYAEDVEWDISGYPTVDLPTRGRGRDNLFDAFRTYYRGWTSYHAELMELIDAGRTSSVSFMSRRASAIAMSSLSATYSRSGRFGTAWS